MRWQRCFSKRKTVGLNGGYHKTGIKYQHTYKNTLESRINGMKGRMMKELDIKYLPIEQIIPYKNNPRINNGAVQYVANSIRDFGFKVPIVVDADNVVVAGDTRLKGAKKLGLKEVPCIVADDLTPEQVKAFRIADNSTADIALWDFDKLEEELAELDEYDFGDFGLEEMADSFSLMDDAGYDVEAKEQEIFSITFNFPIDYETMVKNYIRENGKDEIADMILNKIKGE